MEIEHFITTLRMSDPYIQTIYTQGGCYQFYLVLRKIFGNDAMPMINLLGDHIVTKLGDDYYDITGLLNNQCTAFVEPTLEQLNEAKTWSFAGSKMLQIGECPHCDEPLLAATT